MTDKVPILFVLGPSGAGKTTFGRCVKTNLDFLWIDIDPMPNVDGIDLAGLRTEWDEFFNACHAGAIATTLRGRVSKGGTRGAVLTFSSLVVFSSPQLAALKKAGIRVLILYGSQEDCLAAFLKRERETGRNLTEEHWRRHNCDTHKRLGDSSYDPYRVTVFQAGHFLDCATLMAAVKKHIG